jgi:hypothetical protein
MPTHVTYRPLDTEGRPTGFDAVLSPPLVAGSDADRRIRPPGFESGFLNEARLHLLGNQLGGGGRDARNLFWGEHNPTNTPIMRDIESKVRSAVDGGQIVRYRGRLKYRDWDYPGPEQISLFAVGSGGFLLDEVIVNPCGLRREMSRHLPGALDNAAKGLPLLEPNDLRNYIHLPFAPHRPGVTVVVST